MPTETPHSTRSRSAPRCDARERPAARSSASRSAISTVAFAIGWPRTPANALASSSEETSTPRIRGPRWSRSVVHASSLNSSEYPGSGPATHSPHPSASSVSRRRRIASFVVSSPKEVRNGRTSGSAIRWSSIPRMRVILPLASSVVSQRREVVRAGVALELDGHHPGGEASLERLRDRVAPGSRHVRIGLAYRRIVLGDADDGADDAVADRRIGFALRARRHVAGPVQDRDRAPVGGSDARVGSIEVPADHGPVAPVSAVERVVHLAVEVARESVGGGTELLEVEVGVPREQRIVGPPHDGDARVERLRPLRELQRVADALRPSARTHREHVGVDVRASGVAPQEAEDVAPELSRDERPEGNVSTVLQRPDQLAWEELVLAPRRDHDVEDPIGVLEAVQGTERYPGGGGGVERALPRLAHHRLGSVVGPEKRKARPGRNRSGPRRVSGRSEPPAGGGTPCHSSSNS